jgi:uncharacterized protein YifN (PemK superfamily)
MAIPYQPKPRQIVICDFRGFEPPEMVKRRPVIVLASHKSNSRLVAVVPLSTTPPKPVYPCHCKLREYPFVADARIEVWAKCDMLAVVSTARLSLIRSKRRRLDGRREFLTYRISGQQFDSVRAGVRWALDLDPRLTAGID